MVDFAAILVALPYFFMLFCVHVQLLGIVILQLLSKHSGESIRVFYKSIFQTVA